jgi:hypothetical protein
MMGLTDEHYFSFRFNSRHTASRGNLLKDIRCNWLCGPVRDADLYYFGIV